MANFIPNPLATLATIFIDTSVPQSASIVFKATRTKIGTLDVDATISASHQGDMDVTEHPVEEGSNVADHIRKKPEVLTMEGVVSDTPVEQSERDKLGTMKKPVGRAKDAFDTLRDLRDSGELVTVATRLHTYDNMAITSLVFPDDARTGEAVRFNVTLKQVRKVSSVTVIIKRTKKPSGQPRTTSGTKPAKPVDTRSTAAKLVDAAAKVSFFK